jgi:glycosyltransferase involved in cell wall biosynthesis
MESPAPGALAEAIARLLNAPATLKEMKVNCRNIAENEYSLALQAQRYSQLYKTLTQKAD